MQSITFITGNQKKADYLEKYLGFPIEHVRLDLDEKIKKTGAEAPGYPVFHFL